MWKRTEEELLEKTTKVCLKMLRQIKTPDLRLKVCYEDTLWIVNNNKKNLLPRFFPIDHYRNFKTHQNF